MSSFPSRRRVLTTGAGAALGLGAVGATATSASASPGTAARHATGPEETRTLDELYQAALKEGGKLVVYAGGDTPTQQDGTKAAFKARFPDIDLKVVVDYSKYHDVRVDNQFATDTLVPDVVQLQTLQDFVRWNRQGRLLPYRPAGFSKLHKSFRDPAGAWVAVSVIAFSFLYGTAAVGSDARAIRSTWSTRSGRAGSPRRTRTTTPSSTSTRSTFSSTAGTGRPDSPRRTCSSRGAATRRAWPCPPDRRRSASAPRARPSPPRRPRRSS